MSELWARGDAGRTPLVSAPRPLGRATPATPVVAAAPPRIVIGIGEFAVSNNPEELLVTHALGSCIAVCVWDSTALVAGLLHLLLPDSRINTTRAREQPAAFADTGIPLLFQKAYTLGLEKKRAVVRLVGGAEVADSGASFDIGKRNIVAAKNVLWRNGVLIKGEAVGGRTVRTVNFTVGSGRLQIMSGREQIEEL